MKNKDIELAKLAVEALSCQDVDQFGRELQDAKEILKFLKDKREFPATVSDYFNCSIGLKLDNSSYNKAGEWFKVDKEYYDYLRYTLGFWGSNTPSFTEYKKQYADKEANKAIAKRRKELIKKADEIRNGK